jgi:hypothetical protein
MQSNLVQIGSDIAAILCCVTKSEEEKTKDLILQFTKTQKELGIAPLLVIDEANMLIPGGGGDTKDGEGAAKRITEFLVQQTNDLLASSLHVTDKFRGNGETPDKYAGPLYAYPSGRDITS